MRTGVNLVFVCECGATAEGTDILRKQFVSFSGKSYGWGSRVPVNKPSDLVPEGWWGWDPYTDMTYCPKCREWIEAPPDAKPDAAKSALSALEGKGEG